MTGESKQLLDELVLPVQMGDHAAFEQMVRLLSGPMYSFFRRLGLSPQEADDQTAKLLADLFFKKIHKYRPEPEPERCFWNWLCVVMRNEAKGLWRANQPKPEEIVAGGVAEEYRLRPEQYAGLLLAIEEAIERLGTNDADILRQCFVARMTYEEIVIQSDPDAVPTPQQLGALRVRLLRARVRLENQLAADPRVPPQFFEKGELQNDQVKRKPQGRSARRVSVGSSTSG